MKRMAHTSGSRLSQRACFRRRACDCFLRPCACTCPCRAHAAAPAPGRVAFTHDGAKGVPHAPRVSGAGHSRRLDQSAGGYTRTYRTSTHIRLHQVGPLACNVPTLPLTTQSRPRSWYVPTPWRCRATPDARACTFSLLQRRGGAARPTCCAAVCAAVLAAAWPLLCSWRAPSNGIVRRRLTDALVWRHRSFFRRMPAQFSLFC